MDEKSKIIDRAQKLVQKGYLDKAITDYKKIVDKDPKDATIRLRMGDLYVKIGKKSEAIKEYGEVAKLHTHKGFYLKAIAVYKQILKLDEDLIEIHFKLADLYTKQKLIADAIASLSVLVSFYEKKEKVDEAIDVLKKMITVDPQNVGIRLKLAEYYKKKGFINDALAEYGTVFNSLLKDGKVEKAEKLYQGLYTDNKRNISIVEGLVEVYKNKGDNTQLIRYYKELANLYKEKGEVDKRREVHEKILAISADDNDALNVLGRKVAVPKPDQTLSAKEFGARKAAPSEVPSEEKITQEPLVAWPEFSKDLFEEPDTKPQESVMPAELKEEPLISWNEMVETMPEVGKDSPIQPVEAQKTEPMEEAPLIETPEIEAAEVEAGLEPVSIETNAEEETPLIDMDVKEAAPFEALTEEVSPEYIESVEEIAQTEEIETGKVVEEPAANKGLEGFGLGSFTPEGARIIGEMESLSEEGYVDLSSELGLEEALDFLTESWAPDAQGEATFAEFKHGVEKQLGKEDTETHYNLGIAYMEMELYDDAMREFKIALKDPVFEFDCHNRLGLSFMAKGDYQEAVSQYLKGLKVSGRTYEERKGLMYELGLAYEASENNQEALEIFKSIYEMDKGFRKVSSKVKELTKKSEKEGEIDVIPAVDDMLEVELL